MKNKLFKVILSVIFCLIPLSVSGSEQFNFDVTEVEILEKGNKFIGKKRGVVTTDNGITIIANYFEYEKDKNILNASGKVKILDKINNYEIFSDKITYEKNIEIIYTKNRSKAIILDENLIITANDFYYNKLLNTLIAKKNVEVENNIEDYKILSEHIEYLKNDEKIYSDGDTEAIIKSKYKFDSKNVTFLKNSMILLSKNKAILTDNFNLYNFENYNYSINSEELKGQKIVVSTNYKSPKSDKFYFENGIIDLKNQNFIAKDTTVKIHKDVFGNFNNDPRIKGVSSYKKDNITVVNKGIFTSCSENDDCPPWSIQANEIKHDQNKKQLLYKEAVLRLYNFPVLYFPKFFHPDPTVDRQSGILKPTLNESNVLGTSFTLPYFHVLSHDSDITTTPTIFENNMKMVQNEYRKVGENFELKSNFGYTRGYNSSISNTKKNISYLFTKYNHDLNLDDFNSSKMNFSLNKVTNDTFLKVFDTVLLENSTSLKPSNSDTLSTEINLTLDNNSFNLTSGLQAYENLNKKNSDRYQFVLPYFTFDKKLFPNSSIGSFSFSASGDNTLNNTNQLKSKINNNLSYSTNDFVSDLGIRNNFNIRFKNLNSVGKNVSEYKSSPQIELLSLLEFNSSLPLLKEENEFISYLTPKLSLRANPSDMKNHSGAERTINNGNIFNVDRLGLGDSFEAGESLTLGIDYRKETLEDVNKYFEANLATVFRHKEENFIPSNTTLNKKSSNIFGYVSNKFSEKFNFKYQFAIDNNLDQIEYNDLSSTISLNNFVTTFNFVKEIDEMGDQNFFMNTTSFNFDEKNYVYFKSRRNRQLNLTEFYDLVYEYRNDCLVAGIKYKKTYYEDRDLKPTEDLIFTITLFPLTTYEHRWEDNN